MDSKPFFVMLIHPNCGYTPLWDSEKDNIARFESKKEARASALNNPLGENYGYEIFEMGYGDE